MKYTDIKEIGRGTFGIVTLVQDENGNRYARKTFAAPHLPDVDPQDFRTRFEREVKYQQQMDHPNVIRIHEANLKDNPPWFIMELAEYSLADELRADRSLGGDPREPLFDILAGLEAMHERGFKHRDLKPANILKLRNKDGSTRYAISDFGLMAPGAGMTSTLTGSNMGGGTPLYRPPECAINFKRATTQSDIYSVGAILHEIFGGGTARIPHVELNVAGPIGPIVQKCTKKNLHRRYRNVAELREALYQVLSQENLEFTSLEEEEIVKILSDKDSLSEDEWDRVFSQIDENEEKGASNHILFRAISVSHIKSLFDHAPELFSALADAYASYAAWGTFDFDYCDVIATKAQEFYELAELEVKARIALAMLELGTSHNRWFVERRFMRMAGCDISNALAERIRIEIQVTGFDFGTKIDHLENSISMTRDQLHPTLRELLH